VSNIIEKFGKAIFETPFGTQKIAPDAPELAEIRIAVLDAVKAKSHQASGRSVFPYNLVRINLLGVPAEQAAPFHGEFLAKYFAEELRNGLARSNYRFPDDLFVEITTTPTLPAPNQEWLTVDTLITERVAPEAVTAIHSPAHLVVEAGAAKPSEITINALAEPWKCIEKVQAWRAATTSPSVSRMKLDGASPANMRTFCIRRKQANAVW